ncbi:unnamed protein product [Durusdinium trenchii]|uniref:Uncharacterized protein n=1 Tax=Durusdinium trenchii TaxID=1381693 RepID=A0ABP0N859_9DINO
MKMSKSNEGLPLEVRKKDDEPTLDDPKGEGTEGGGMDHGNAAAKVAPTQGFACSNDLPDGSPDHLEAFLHSNMCQVHGCFGQAVLLSPPKPLGPPRGDCGKRDSHHLRQRRKTLQLMRSVSCDVCGRMASGIRMVGCTHAEAVPKICEDRTLKICNAIAWSHTVEELVGCEFARTRTCNRNNDKCNACHCFTLQQRENVKVRRHGRLPSQRAAKSGQQYPRSEKAKKNERKFMEEEELRMQKVEGIPRLQKSLIQACGGRKSVIELLGGKWRPYMPAVRSRNARPTHLLL